MKRFLLPLANILLLFSLFACQSLTNITSSLTTESSLITPTLIVDHVNLQVQPTDIPPSDQPAIPNLVALEDSLVAIYENTSPGVVAIRVMTESGRGLGSGFVIDKEGHIITNFHVIEGVTDIEVDFPSGFKTRGPVIGSDTDSDLAV
ncbi:MAG: S1C family serine protease, partial [Anaerolineales bacterium]|nr:S1C family serine protease [Anaerolineales bacterium]